MTILITSALIVLAGILILYIPKIYEHKHPIQINGHVEPGYENVLQAFRKNFETKAEPEGAAFAAYVDGLCVVDVWGGYADGAHRIPWQADTLANSLSVTKGMAVVAIGHLVDRGRLKVQAPVAKYWPEFGQNGKENITVAQLLSHRAGLPFIDRAITVDLIKRPAELGKYLAAQPPAWPPGQKRGYHVFTIGFYLDQIVRHVDPKGRGIAAYFEEEIGKPFDVDFYMGLPRDLEYKVATLKNEPYFRSLRGFFQKVRFGFMIYSNPMTKKALMNPDFIVKSQSLALNKPEIRSLQFPSVVGIGTARSLAKIYGILGNGGRSDGKTLLTPETIDILRNETSPICEKDVIMGTLYKFSLANGFVLIPNPFGKVNFGFPGHGLQLAFADPAENVGYAYLTNTIANDQLNDVRGHNLVKALYQAINSAQVRKSRGRATLEDKLGEGKEAVFGSIKTAIKDEKEVDLGRVVEERTDDDHHKGILGNVINGLGMFSNDGDDIKVVSDLPLRTVAGDKSHQRESLLKRVGKFILPYVPLASLLVLKHRDGKDSTTLDKSYYSRAQGTIKETANKLSGDKTPKDIKSILDQTRKSLIDMSDHLSDFVHVKKRKNSLGETITDKYYESKAYIDDTNHMILDAAKRLSKASADDAHHIVDHVGQYLVGMKDYATGNQKKGYFQSSFDSLIDIKDNIVDSIHPHKKGYLESAYDSVGNLKDTIIETMYPHKHSYIESARSTILDTAHKLSGAKSHNDIKSILDNTRKSLVDMSDYLSDFVHVKKRTNSLGDIITDKYYESKSYVDATNQMILEAARKLSKAGTDDAHYIIDQAGQYLVGMKDYATGNQKKGYFQTSIDAISDIKDNIIENIHPHQKGVFEKAIDRLDGIKVVVLSKMFQNNNKGYLERSYVYMSQFKDMLLDAVCPPKSGILGTTHTTFNDIKYKLINSLRYYTNLNPKPNTYYSRVYSTFNYYTRRALGYQKDKGYIARIYEKFTHYKNYWFK